MSMRPNSQATLKGFMYWLNRYNQEDAIMQAFGFLTLSILMFAFLEMEIASSNPCSQFSDPSRQAFCSSDDFPLLEFKDED